jgi:hypothetical protein
MPSLHGVLLELSGGGFLGIGLINDVTAQGDKKLPQHLSSLT